MGGICCSTLHACFSSLELLKLSFSQSWLPEHEPDFHPGMVEISLINGVFLQFEATLIQPRVRTNATAHQQRLWEQGDVVEFFIQKVGSPDYYEYQIAPNGMMLALHYPDQTAVAAVRSGKRKLEEYLSDLLPEGSASVTPDGWQASLMIPLPHENLGNLKLNCGRYDYSPTTAPIVSSTSKLTKRDFHHLDEWTLFQ